MKGGVFFGLVLLLGLLMPLWGSSWGWTTVARARFPNGPIGVLEIASGPVGAVAVDPHDGRRLYLGGAEGLFHSTDGGRNWSLWSRQLLYPHILLVDPFDPTRLYAARRDLASFLPMPGVYCSDDGGQTWKRFTAGLAEERIFALAVDPGRRDVLYAGSRMGRVYRSVDGGEHWSPASPEPLRRCPTSISPPVGHLLVHPLDGALYASLSPDGGTFRSTDGGKTGEMVHGDGGYLAVDALRGDLYLAGRRLQRSTDGGRTWEDLSAGLPYDPRRGLFLSGWIAVEPAGGRLYTRYHRSTDGGKTWERLGWKAGFVPRLLVAGPVPTLYGSFNGRAGCYRDTAREEPVPPAGNPPRPSGCPSR